MEKYIIDEDTLAITPLKHLKFNSKVYTKNGVLKCIQKPLDIIKESCIEYYSDYEGRRKATIIHTNFRHKVPIIISKTFNICAFPTNSPKLFYTSWIFANNLVYISKVNNKKSEILFNDHTRIHFNISKHVLINQLTRTYALMHKIDMLKERNLSSINQYTLEVVPAKQRNSIKS